MIELTRAVQDRLCLEISGIDGKQFHEDRWERPGGGGGITRILENGSVFEKAGINTSVVFGELPDGLSDEITAGKRSSTNSRKFWATGISLVIHPDNPFVPTIHANYRYFEKGEEGGEQEWWFGGGTDLTPNYLFEEDVVHFHSVLKSACDRHDRGYYPRFKKWCDEYFHITHRKECRGVGGIFFDHMNSGDKDKLFSFVSDCAHAISECYIPIVKRRQHTPFGDAQKEWQRIRRGRYVEFNLVYDRGTTFGLKTGGRIESILMSLPETAKWKYNHSPEKDSPEEKLLQVLQKPQEWLH